MISPTNPIIPADYKSRRERTSLRSLSLVALSSVMLFDPKNYGMEPHASSTACWRGYWCEYAIEDDELLLKDLYLYNSDDKYPPLNGVEVSLPEFKEYKCQGGKKIIMKAHFGHRVYKDVNIPIPYTGKILLGDGFMREYYIHMGFQRGWAYKKLIELVFEEGILLECNDLSHIAKAQREAMVQGNINPQRPDVDILSKFVDDSFSLDYADKAWWME